MILTQRFCVSIFLSTLSLRRATFVIYTQYTGFQHFYPRSPCGERRGRSAGRYHQNYFYPRSPCGERPPAENAYFTAVQFLSTLSLRRATRGTMRKKTSKNISIHALLAESDRQIDAVRLAGFYFYPRSPCGERRVTCTR